MPKKSLLLAVSPRDCDADGYYDLRVDVPAMCREVGDSRWMAPVRRAVGGTTDEVVRGHLPGAHVDGATGTVSMNEGYDGSMPAGLLEQEMWDLVKHDVVANLARSTGRALSLAA